MEGQTTKGSYKNSVLSILRYRMLSNSVGYQKWNWKESSGTFLWNIGNPMNKCTIGCIDQNGVMRNTQGIIVTIKLQ